MEPLEHLKKMARAQANLSRLVASLPDEETLYDEIVRIAVFECGLSHAMVAVPDSSGWIQVRSAQGKNREAFFRQRSPSTTIFPKGGG